MPVLQLKNLRKTFNPGLPSEVEVLHGVDLTLLPGEFVTVMGPSGSGKSTLLNLVGLLDAPTGGQLEILGRQTTDLDDATLTRLRGLSIGFVFQYHHLISAFTALENIVLPMVAQAGYPTPDMFLRAAALLEGVGLSAWRDAPIGHLSGGQQQRVAIARALAMQPALLLADEPTGNLDSVNAAAVFEMLRKVCGHNKTAALFVTHNEMLAKRCDRIIRVQDGLIKV